MSGTVGSSQLVSYEVDGQQMCLPGPVHNEWMGTGVHGRFAVLLWLVQAKIN